MEKECKQTATGFPNDWKIDCIKNLAAITTGARNTQDKIDSGQYPFFVRSQKVERINTYSFDGEAVLTAGDGVGTGKIFHYIKGKFDFHQRVYKISNFNEKIDGFFFYLYFSNAFLKRIMSMTAKSSVDSVRMDMIAEMLVPLPPKEEQIAIGKAILDSTKLVESLDKLIEKKKNIKQGAMQELLTGKKRLPTFKNSWVISKIGTLGDFRAGSGFPLKFQGDEQGKYPFYKVSDMNNEGNEIFMINSNNYISQVKAKEIGAYIFPKNTIIFAKIGAAIFLERKKVLSTDSCIDNNLMGFITDQKKMDFMYMYYYFKKIKFSKLSSATALPSLNSRDIEELSLTLPPDKEEQTAISQLLLDMDTEIEMLEQKRDKCRFLKVGLMQQLLTGRIRLKCPS